jgi:hypothetical protein
MIEDVDGEMEDLGEKATLPKRVPSSSVVLRAKDLSSLSMISVRTDFDQWWRSCYCFFCLFPFLQNFSI